MEMIKMSLRMFLQKKGITQKFMAKKMGINSTTLCLHINKVQPLSEARQRTMAKFLGITFKEFKELSSGPHFRKDSND